MGHADAGQRHAHDRHRDQLRVGDELGGDSECREAHAEQQQSHVAHRRVAVDEQDPSHGSGSAGADERAARERGRDEEERVGVETRDRDIEHHDREDRAERVDQHALAHQHGTDVVVEPDASHERSDHGRSRHRHERAKDERRLPREQVGDARQQRTGDERAQQTERQQVAYDAADPRR